MVIHNAEQAQTHNENDFYDQEGFLCCGICGERKQRDVELGNLQGRRRLPRDCACDRLKKQEEEAKAQLQLKLEHIARLKKDCFPDNELLSWTFENDAGKQKKMGIGRRYVSRWEKVLEENIGLLLYGNVGTGKSYCACAIANALCEMEVPVKYVNLAEVLNELQTAQNRNDYIQRLVTYKLLIIDDFGVQRQTEYAAEQIFNLIDRRNRKRLPLIVTTNLTLDEIKHPADTSQARIYDRVLQMCTPVLFKGVSLRSNDTERKRKILTEILGS
jgi:DNA replication protein DnaC